MIYQDDNQLVTIYCNVINQIQKDNEIMNVEIITQNRLLQNSWLWETEARVYTRAIYFKKLVLLLIVWEVYTFI